MHELLKTLAGMSVDFNHSGFEYRMVKPFGPTILETKVPDDIFTKLLDLSRELLVDASRESYGQYLVGQVAEEPFISNRLLERFGVADYLSHIFSEYVLGMSYANADLAYQAAIRQAQSQPGYVNPVKISIEAAWLVCQFEGEYNPIHNHSGAALSSVMYLEIPWAMSHSRIPGKPDTDGNIEWVDGGGAPLQNLTVRVTPQAQYFYIFPSSLLHLVYPFKGPGRRISIAINANFSQ